MEWVVLVVLISALLFIVAGAVRIYARLDRLQEKFEMDIQQLARDLDRRLR